MPHFLHSIAAATEELELQEVELGNLRTARAERHKEITLTGDYYVI